MNTLILEDHYGIRAAYKDVLEHALRNGDEVTYDFALSYDEFVEKFSQINPDIVWLDHRIPGKLKGSDVAHWVTDNHPETKIIRMSSFKEAGYPQGTRHLGKRYSFSALYRGSRMWVEDGSEPDWYDLITC